MPICCKMDINYIRGQDEMETQIYIPNHRKGLKDPNHGTGIMMMIMTMTTKTKMKMMILPYCKENYYQNKYTYTAT